MGLDDKRFCGDVDDDFRCPICRDIVEDPIASQCEHVFCKTCIYQWLQKETSCPVDRKSLDLSQLCDTSRYFRNFYSKLIVKCVFDSNGCEERYKIEELDSHQNKCKYNSSAVSECEKKCGSLLAGNHVRSHNCVEYLKSINLKYEIDLSGMKKKQTEQSDLIINLKTNVDLKDSEIQRLENTIKCWSQKIEKANKIESEQHQFVSSYESMLSTQSNAIQELREKLKSQFSISTRCTAINQEDKYDSLPKIIFQGDIDNKSQSECSQQIDCLFVYNGCEERYQIEELDNHQNKCKYNPSAVNECEKGCGSLLTGNHVRSHNCIEYLKSINLKYETDLSEMNKKQTEQSYLILNLKGDNTLKCIEIQGLKNTIIGQNEEIEKANKRESVQQELIKIFESTLLTIHKEIESMLPSKTKAVDEVEEKPESQPTISTSRDSTVQNKEETLFEGGMDCNFKSLEMQINKIESVV